MTGAGGASAWLLVASSAVLAGCGSLGNSSSSEKDNTLYTPSQSNLTSLTEVIENESSRFVIIVTFFAIAFVFLFVFFLVWLLSKEDIGSYQLIRRV